MHLPGEIWLHISEQVEFDTYCRADLIQRMTDFAQPQESSQGQHDLDSEAIPQRAVQLLPPFERRA